MIKTAYFRTYLPAERVGILAPPVAKDEALSVTDDGIFMWTEPTDDDALFVEWQHNQYACPRNARIRMLEGALAFTETYPALRTVTEIERLGLALELSELRASTRLPRSYILSSPWHVPLRWFAAFAPSERDLYDVDGTLSIRYRTSIGDSVDRVHWAASVLSGAGFPQQVIERMNDLERWLMEFSADSMVELDYAAVAGVFSEPDLVLDDSVDDVRSSLLALEQGDGEASQRHYEMVASRWFQAQAFTFSN